MGKPFRSDDDRVWWDSEEEDWTGENADLFTSYTPGTCDWKDSLVERPKAVK